mgnify:FL=1
MRLEHLKSRDKKTLIVTGVILVLMIVYGIYIAFSAGSGPVTLSPEFIAARNDAATVSREAVGLANETNSTLKRAILLNPQKEYSEMLRLFEEARKTNNNAYDEVFALSRYLQKIAESLGGILNTKSQRLAYDASITELSLINEFIVYTRYVNEFLDMLSYSTPDEIQTRAGAAEKLLFDVSASAKKINDLNAQFLEKMGKFDESLQ